MFKDSKTLFQRTIVALAVFLSLAVALYSLVLLTIGQPLIHGAEGSSFWEIRYQPMQLALAPLLAALLVFIGLLSRSSVLHWLGLGGLIMFSILSVFGIGGNILPFTVILLILLLMIQITSKRTMA